MEKGEQISKKLGDEVPDRNTYISGNLEELMHELQLMKALGHLYWGVWALATVPLDKRDQPVFNYHYSLTRLDGYMKTKKP